MRNLKTSLAVILISLFLVNLSLAVEPGLILEKSVAGKRALGNLAEGSLILSTPERISTLTLEGKELSPSPVKSNQGLVASGDGKFFGITTFSENTPSGFLGAEKFELFSVNGAKLWQLTHPPVADFYISNKANWIVGIASGGDGPESYLIFYNHAGDSITSIKVGFLQGIFFSTNGMSVFVNSAKEGLVALSPVKDTTTKTLEKTSFGPCDNFATSASGEYVATFTEGDLNFFYQGKPVGNFSKEDFLVRRMSFSPDGKYLSVIDKKSLFLFETETGKLLWEHLLDKPELSFISLDVTSHADRIIAGVDFDKGNKENPEDRHTRGFIYLLDKSGKTVWTKELSYKLWGVNFPKVQFSPDGTKFSVLTREKIYLFKSNQ